MPAIRLGDIAYARSGDKGSGANIGVIALGSDTYDFLRQSLTAAVVQEYFAPLGAVDVRRYDLPNLRAFNFVLPGALGPGGSLSLRIDAQGKALGQAILELKLVAPQTTGAA